MKKNTYKIMPIILAIMVIFSTICLPSTKVMAKTTGTTSDGFYYTSYDTYVTITGYSGSATEITIPDTIDGIPVTSIGEGAFSDCSELISITSITIPNSVTSIGSYAFGNCTSLTSINVDINNKHYKSVDGVLFNLKLTELICYPTGKTNENYEIPSTITSIYDFAFNSCSSLTSVTIPDSVISIGSSAFGDCTSLTSINVDINNKHYKSIDGVLFNFNLTELMCYPTGKTNKSYEIPNTITSISEAAFSSCTSLTSVTIPDSVTSIGDYAFYYCTSLANVTIPNSIKSIGNSVFYSCTGLVSVTIPDSVTSIDDFAFQNCSGLTSITIPDSVTNIGNNAFSGCSGLTNVIIPDGITSIGESVFRSCIGLKSITIPDSVTSIDNDAFYNCVGLTSVTIPDSVTSIGNGAFNNCVGLTSITIPNSVISIGNGAFYRCGNVTNVSIGSNVTSIGDYAFYYCYNITNLTIKNSLASIGNSTFYYCDNLNESNITIYQNPDDSNNTKTFYLNGSSVTITLNKTAINAIAAINAGSATLENYIYAGIIGVTTANLDNINSAVASAKSAKGSDLTKTEIQTAEIKADVTVEITNKDNTLTAKLKGSDGTNFTGSSGLKYKWYRDDNVIEGENYNTYKLYVEDIGKSIRVNVIDYSLVSNIIDIPSDYTFPITTVSSISDINVENGTDIGEVNLPTIVDVKLDNSRTTSAAVTWDNGSADYDGNTEGTYTFTGILTMPSGVTNPNNLTASIDVNVGEADDENPTNETTPAAITVSITGTETVGNTLSAELIGDNVSEVTTGAAVTYEWSRLPSEDSTSGTQVGTNKTYTLVSSDGDNYIKVVVYCDGVELGNDITGKIATESADGNSSNNNSSSNSSHHHHHTATTTKTSTTAETATVSNSTKPVSLANMTREDVKEFEAKVVSNIIAVIGQGTTAGEAKEVEAPEGAKVSVTNITKDGTSAGFVITSEASSLSATIPVHGAVNAVYKYIPLLNKYIQVPGAVITANSVTLPVQANATYVASSVVLPSTETVTQGWVQVDNKWYMVNAAGDILTGWVNDGKGWVYLSPTDGVMETGLVKDGNNSYYMAANGYMVTGWFKIDEKWHYFNANGSMASNTVIDGYTLDENGAWIK